MTSTDLGRDAEGYRVVRNRDDDEVRVSECCGATAKGCGPYAEGETGYVGCRKCYQPIDEQIALPAERPYTKDDQPADDCVICPPGQCPGPTCVGNEASPEDERVRVYGEDGEPHDVVLRTKSGKVLTEADLNTLAADAEDDARTFRRQARLPARLTVIEDAGRAADPGQHAAEVGQDSAAEVADQES